MMEEIVDGFKFQKNIDGTKKLIIESSRLDECIKYIQQGNSTTITINSFQGYDLPDIEFLEEVKDMLEGLHLPETKFDIKVVNSLHNLRFLGLADNKKDIIDLNNFPKLESLACDFSARLKGLERCEKLVYLTLTGYKSKMKSLNNLPLLEKLKEFHLFKTDILSLEGIEKFRNLEKFEIFSAPKLETIDSLEYLAGSLLELEIEKCKKINDFEVLGKLKALKKLRLSDSGSIKNLAFLEELSELKFVSFWGTSILDGDLNYCKGIDFVGFDNKRHYTHKLEEFR